MPERQHLACGWRRLGSVTYQVRAEDMRWPKGHVRSEGSPMDIAVLPLNSPVGGNASAVTWVFTRVV